MKNTQHQSGFTLLELSITVVIGGMMILAMIQMQTYQAQLEKARAVAQTYQRLNQAAGTYMVNHYPKILAVSDACSAMPVVGATSGLAIPTLPNDCGGNIRITGAIGAQEVAVANLRQPTLQELRAAGYLDANAAGANNTLPLPTFFTSAGNPNQMVHRVNNVLTPINPGFAVLINKPDQNSRDLRSLVFNLQPFNLGNNNFGGESLLNQVLLAAGSDGFLSGGDATGNLRPQDGGAVNAPIPNPLRIAANAGAPNVFAMRNGYGSSGWDQYVRRDGQTPLTGNWNVSGDSDTLFNITNIGNVGANTVTATGQIQGGSFNTGGTINATGAITGGSINTAGAVTGGSINTAGAVTGGTGVFGSWDPLNQIQAALRATTAYIRDTLTVGTQLIVTGDTDLNTLTATGATRIENTLTATGATTLAGLTAGATGVTTLTASGATTLAGLTANNTSVEDFRLRNQAKIGNVCNADTQTITRNEDATAEITLLYCLNGTWQPTTNLANVYDFINGINTNLNTINANLNTTNTNLNTINTNLTNSINTTNTNLNTINTNLTNSISQLDAGVLDLQGKQLNYDLINVQWDRVTSVGGPSQSKVWKKTPWTCSPVGQLTATGVDGVRHLQNASGNQLTTTFTMPMVVGIDQKPLNDTHVFDFSCVSQSEAATYGVSNNAAYWYIGMSSVQINLQRGNSCRQGLSTTPNFSDRHYIFQTMADIGRLDTSGALLGSILQGYPKITVKMGDSEYKSEIGLPTGGYSGKRIVLLIDSTWSVKVNLNGGSETLSKGSYVLYTHNGTRWNRETTVPSLTSNCQGVPPAPLNLDSYNEEPMAGRFIAFIRNKAP
ncbi:prepilin-type N-terminal cleavage/methylation domain-containing protein [Limnohabitans sp.]|jgi:prepilin-type N-terminal cleavage/methylation domain-containing protein|uniref:prepilin-type N-terminal cleavage/methylation domain-containing protein n=1 Tax=Limnohabitans sp. TaxID=1907725 RepID=UPI0037BF6829